MPLRQSYRLQLDGLTPGLLFALQLVPTLLFFSLPCGPFLAFAEQLHRRAMGCRQRPRLVHGRKRILRPAQILLLLS
jgi:hypothetical protein